MMTESLPQPHSLRDQRPLRRGVWQRVLAAGLAMSMVSASWAQAAPPAAPAPSSPVAPAVAGLVPTDAFATTALEARQLLEAQSRLLELLKREDLAAALTQRGIDVVEAQARVAALTLAQVKALSDQLDKLPAGSSEIITSAVFVFVLLLITDILGFTKVFPFTRSVR